MNLEKKWIVAGIVVLMAILECELLFSVRQNSQTFDESAHIYSGYSYWKSRDFGINPEHPPLIKLEATLPLLPTGIAVPPPLPINFRAASAAGGARFLYSNDADSLLFKARAAVSVFALTCALLVFLAAYEMFGAGAGLIALLVLVFEPNILANGALVGTDMGASVPGVRRGLHVLSLLKKALYPAAFSVLPGGWARTGSEALDGVAAADVCGSGVV